MMVTEAVAAELAIRNVYSAYTFAIDDLDADALVDCFTPDAEIEMTGFAMLDRMIADRSASFINEKGRVVGASNIRAMLDAVPRNVVTLHLTNNIWITRLDAARAQAQAAFTVLMDGYIGYHGRYLDTVSRCVDGRWRFSERRDVCRYERG
jgi:hypothetical protein